MQDGGKHQLLPGPLSREEEQNCPERWAAETLKARDRMARADLMNICRAQAEETVGEELVFG